MPIDYNPVAIPQFQMLTHEQCEAVHRASLEILRCTGVRVIPVNLRLEGPSSGRPGDGAQSLGLC